jgi:hypothetical protein
MKANHKLFPVLFLLASIFWSKITYGQNQFKLKGKVVSKGNIPAKALQVRLLKNDTVVVHKAVTDKFGSFKFEAAAGNYILLIEQQDNGFIKRSIHLNADIDLGELLIDEVVQLNGINVIAHKKIIERKVDRLVFNIENSIASQGMNGIDALRNTPLIRIQDDNVSIVGKGNVVIMLNERILNLSQSEQTAYLQSLRSDDIARIEVITTPPSKYEAAGNSGMINIILKKNPNLGWSGNVNGFYQKTSFYGYGSGATINYQSRKLSVSLKLRQYDQSSKPTGTRNLIGSNNSIYTSEIRKDNPNALGFNYNVDYRINQKQNIGIIYDFNRQHNTMNANGESIYKHHEATDSTLKTLQQQKWKTPTHTLNTYYDFKLDTLGKKLSITANFLSNAPDKVNDFNTASSFTGINSQVRNRSHMDYNIYSGQADFTLPFKWGNIETGAKYTAFDNKSTVEYYNLIGSAYKLESLNSSIFQYKEYNYAGYFSFQKDFNERWSTKAGLRYEYTRLNGSSPGAQNDIVGNKYGKLFPTAYLKYKPNDLHTFTISYSKRIERPSFQVLNPFRWYTNPYMYFTGTPTLSPSFNDNIELTYTFKSKLSSTLYHQYNKNGLSNIARLMGGTYSNLIENAYNEHKTGFQLSFNDTFYKIWETSISTTGTYTTTNPIIAEAERLELGSFSYSINNTISLNKARTWFMLLNFWHDLPYVYANIKIATQMNLSPGIKTSIFDKKLNVSLVVSDLLKTLTSEGYSYNSGYRNEFYNYFDQRRLSLSLNYSFGNIKVKGAAKTIKFEEKSRAN